MGRFIVERRDHEDRIELSVIDTMINGEEVARAAVHKRSESSGHVFGAYLEVKKDMTRTLILSVDLVKAYSELFDTAAEIMMA